jgi:FkbM family methyltransferase
MTPEEIFQHEVKRWFNDLGDATHRINYDLDKNSIVFDLGGFTGDFASNIYSKYFCNVYSYEPVKKYFEILKNRYSNNNKIKVFNYGLSDTDKELSIHVSLDASSLYGDSETIDTCIFKKFNVEMLNDLGIDRINLLKINIEGGEYDLLEYFLTQEELINKIDNIQVQFHYFIEDSEKRMLDIKRKLSKTHNLTYEYNFVWENWKIK